LQIYSDTFIKLLAGARREARQILNSEMGLIVKRTRFLFNQYLYPLTIVAFEHSSKLGYFDYHTYQIGINKKLFLNAKTTVLKNVLRHELAHYYTYLKYGITEFEHGKEFKSVCQDFGWGEDVSSAAVEISKANEEIEGDLHTEKIIIKIQKLLSLGSSDNIHEAQAATLKANQLLLKHNLAQRDIKGEELFYISRSLEAKRNSQKLQSISEIARTFFVHPVFNYGKGVVYLELMGKKENVLVAEYVCHFLDHEFEKLWKQAQKENPKLKGMKAKNSFFVGLAQGFTQKQESFNSQNQKAIIKIQTDLSIQVRKFYSGLSSMSMGGKRDQDSLKLGNIAGKNLSIRQGIKDKARSILLLGSN